MNRIVETLVYTLRPGTGAEFDQVMQEVSAPLHRSVGMDVVSYGNSLHDPDAYVLIRAYDSLEHMTESHERFYQSDAWRQGPRQAIVDRIVASLKVVTELPAAAVESIRQVR